MQSALFLCIVSQVKAIKTKKNNGFCKVSPFLKMKELVFSQSVGPI